VREKPVAAEDLRAFAHYALTLQRTRAVRVERLLSELREGARLSRREARFVESLVGGRPMEDPRRTLAAGVLSKTSTPSLGDVHNALLEAFFAHGRPF
jgi:hypothetical protein